MRTQDYLTILENSHQVESILVERVQKNNTILSRFSNVDNFRKSITQLEQCDLFDSEISDLKDTIIYSNSSDIIEVLEVDGRIVDYKINILLKLYRSFRRIFSQLTKTPNENSIMIKVARTNDLEGISESVGTFHKIISQLILNQHINGEIKVENVENGSIWLEVYLGSAAAIALIGSLSWASAVIFKKIQEGRIFQQHVTSLKIKNESLKEMQEAQKKYLDLAIESEAKHIFSENFVEPDNEMMERIKNSIKLLSDQIDKGAEIHPALYAPETVSNLFPDFKQLSTIQTKIKQLTE